MGESGSMRFGQATLYSRFKYGHFCGANGGGLLSGSINSKVIAVSLFSLIMKSPVRLITKIRASVSTFASGEKSTQN